ncbi:MAG: hypothetical protein FD145_98 [Candidatus Saganbacteria bacterium]|uniref:Dehydrogenase E1 component domain-containing protein n=1 Tax=Candidatus Saganbacteria bacterium TaxID=2575572 RepID=A0A833L540_UNCSA|nr:MAG: hypothetical protein FD145_98 [Candidatus Saganbacteria bacterium]
MRKKFFEQMLLIRLFEEKIEELFTQGILFGTTHACIGQEAVAVGITQAMNEGDIITSNHRGHGHFIASTDDVDGLMAELMGKATGICAGRSGSQHLCKGDFYANGITGGMTAVATGMALAEKLKKSERIVISFFGDGALGEGVLYESLNMASLWKLPIVYVLENNYYAMSTHISCGVAGSMIDRAKAFGIEAQELNTNDVEVIYSSFEKIADGVRKQSRPHFLVINTYRQCGHSKSDDCNYRTREEEIGWKDKDPLTILGARLDKDVKNSIREKCASRIESAVEKASKADFPKIDSIYEGLFQ